MNTLLHAILTYLLNALWQAPLLWAAAWLLAGVARRMGALAAEHRIWVAALLSQAILPALAPPLHRLAYAAYAALHPSAAQPMTVRISLFEVPAEGSSPLLTMLLRTAVAAYFFIVVLLLLRFLLQLLATLRLRSTAVPTDISSADLYFVNSACRRLGIAPVPVAMHQNIHAPVTFGLRRPILLAPASLMDLDDAEARHAALAHELVHVARRDFAKNLAYRALSLSVAWHPCVWLTARALRLTREQLCDREAARLTGGAPGYSHLLLHLAALLLQQSSPALQTHGVGIFDSTDFERRITMLACTAKPLTRTARSFLLAGIGSIALATFTAAVALGGTPAFAAATELSGTDTPHAVPSNVMAGQVISKIQPKYPVEAKQKKIQGIVLLHAVIGKDGLVEALTVISGPEELRASAIDAVRQWVYKPYLLNGEPTEVETTVTINYSLGEAPPAATGATGSPQALSTPVLHPEVLPVLTKQVPAIYPAAAKQQKIAGEVLVGLLVDDTGEVQDVEALSGPSALRQAAVDAVQQYQFRPATLHGTPVATKMRVSVDFQVF